MLFRLLTLSVLLLVEVRADRTGPPDTSVFPVHVSATILNAGDLPARIYLERDDSRRWQQYLDSTVSAAGGKFTLRVYQPGLYWVLAQLGDGKEMKDGACLVAVRNDGSAEWRRTPPGWPGRKWGGDVTKICSTGSLQLVPRYRHPRHIRSRVKRTGRNAAWGGARAHPGSN